MARESVPGTSLDALLAEPRHGRGESVTELWRAGGSIIGTLNPLIDGPSEPRFDLLDTVRVLAMSEVRDPDVVARVIENSRTGFDGDAAALQAAAALVLTRPEVMRWISTHSAAVAGSPNWKATLPGLGGAVTSVPLAEEALGHLMAAKADLPAELGRYVQLNPWFTRRFAVQLRRSTGGRRVRFQDRAATTRAWSHARSLLGSKVPPQWRSRTGRGSKRPIDDWSHRFLVRYTELVRRSYRRDGIPAVMAPLFAIASAVDGVEPPDPHVVAGWGSLPAPIERDALNLVGLGPSPVPGLVAEIREHKGVFPLKASRSMIPRISWR